VTDPLGPVAIVGPTAAGKSALAMALAESFPLEIVNADALQMYAGLDIGTAKPTASERERVPHHCLDLWLLEQPASVAAYQRAARSAVADIAARGRLPVIVGGSALYVRAVADELEIPPHDAAVRGRLIDLADEIGGPAMHERLATLDPAAAAAIDPRNTRRVIRALEVVELTGSFPARLPPRQSWLPTLWLGVDEQRQVLDARVAERTAAMWALGLRRETEELMRAGLERAPTAGKAIGYAQAIAVVRGQMPETLAREEMTRLTRQLARRQQRAFRQDHRIRWVGAGTPAAVAAESRALIDGWIQTSRR
jgi:tRNA dimethylallyltransferase